MSSRGTPTVRHATAATAVAAIGLLLVGCSVLTSARASSSESSQTSSTLLPHDGSEAGPSDAEVPATTAAPAPRTARLVFTGDLLLHMPVNRRALEYANAHSGDAPSVQRYEYGPMFAQVREALSGADLAICHLESPLSADNTDLSGYPLFNVPGDLASAMAQAGYDGCSTASNHSIDRGVEGIRETLETLERHGLGHAGMARTEAEAQMPRLYRVNDIMVAHLSYTYGLNGLILPEDHLWAVNLIDADAIAGEARAAVAAGAEFVVASVHWGWEYTHQTNDFQHELAQKLLGGTEVDLIVGTHGHVVQPIGRIGDKYVIYGLGNFLSNQNPSPESCGYCPVAVTDGVMVAVTVAEAPSGEIATTAIHASPTWVERPQYTIVDVAEALGAETDPDRRVLLEQSWQRTASVIADDSLGVTVKGDTSVAGAPSR